MKKIILLFLLLCGGLLNAQISLSEIQDTVGKGYVPITDYDPALATYIQKYMLLQDYLEDSISWASVPVGLHDAVTLAGSYDYITLSGQVITRNQIDLTTDVTGLLPYASLSGAPTLLSQFTDDLGHVEESTTVTDLANGLDISLSTYDITVSPDFVELTTETTIDGTDYIIIHDATTPNDGKITYANLLADIVSDASLDLNQVLTNGNDAGGLDAINFAEVEADEFIGDLRGAVLFKAQAGENLAKGEVVYVSGISGNTTIVSKADADDVNKMPAFGVVAAAASSPNPVDIYTFGTLSNLNTSGFTIGDILYVSTTAGQLTATPPTGESALIQNIAKVTRVDNSAGSIKISGAGRTNATPNLNTGRLFVGNASNQAVADGTMYVDIANSRVGVNTTSPSATLDINGDVEIATVNTDNTTDDVLVHSSDGTVSKRTLTSIGDEIDLNLGDDNLTVTTAAIRTLDVSNSNRFSFVGSQQNITISDEGYLGVNYAFPNRVMQALSKTNSYQETFLIQQTGSTGVAEIGIVHTQSQTDFDDLVIGMSQTGASYIANNKTDADAGLSLTTVSTTGDIKLRTQSTDRLVVDQDGNVGIGTNSPSVRLHAKSSTLGTLINDELAVARFGVAGGNIINLDYSVKRNAAGSNWYNTEQKLSFNVDENANKDVWIKSINATSTSDNVLAFGEGASEEWMRIDNGNVGIGTSSPSNTLDVVGNGEFAAPSGGWRFIEVGSGHPTDATGSYIDLVGDATYTDYGLRILRNSGANATDLFIHRGTGNMIFENREAANMTFETTNIERMRITSDGNVGIATSSPDFRLEVVGDGDDIPLALLRGNGSNGYSGISFRDELDVQVGNILSRKAADVGNLKQDGLSINAYTNDLTLTAYNGHSVSIWGSSTGSSFNSVEHLTVNNNGNTTLKGTLKIQHSPYTNAPTLLLGADSGSNNTTVSVNTDKRADIGIPHYSGGSTPFIPFIATSTSTGNNLNFGGGTAYGYAATQINFKTASNTTTTGASSAMFIDNSQRVGIGTSSPSAKLDVVGTSEFSDDMNVDSNTFFVDASTNRVGIGTSSPVALLNVSTVDMTVTPNTLADELLVENSSDAGITILSGNTSTGNLFFADNGGTGVGRITYDHSANSLAFRTNSADRLTILSNGNVGIGTTSPDFELDIESSALTVLEVESTGSSQAGLQLKNTNGRWYTYVNNAGSGDLRFYDGVTSRVTFEHGGDVGIGTTSPTWKLDVSTGANASESYFGRNVTTDGIRVLSTSGRTGYISEVANAYSTKAGEALYYAIFPFDSGHNGYAYRTSVGTTLTDTYWTDYDGNGYFAGKVGIGTQSPAKQLEIENTGADATMLIQTTDDYNAYIEYQNNSGGGGLNYRSGVTTLEHWDISSSGQTMLRLDRANNRVQVIDQELRVSSTGSEHVFFNTDNWGIRDQFANLKLYFDASSSNPLGTSMTTYNNDLYWVFDSATDDYRLRTGSYDNLKYEKTTGTIGEYFELGFDELKVYSETDFFTLTKVDHTGGFPETASFEFTDGGYIRTSSGIEHKGDTNTQMVFADDFIRFDAGGWDLLHLEERAGLVNRVVINQNGTACEFRVESDTDSNAIFMDGISGDIGFGTNTPSAAVDIIGDLEVNGEVHIENDLLTIDDNTRFFDITQNVNGTNLGNSTSHSLNIKSNNITRIEVTGEGRINVNDVLSLTPTGTPPNSGTEETGDIYLHDTGSGYELRVWNGSSWQTL